MVHVKCNVEYKLLGTHSLQTAMEFQSPTSLPWVWNLFYSIHPTVYAGFTHFLPAASLESVYFLAVWQYFCFMQLRGHLSSVTNLKVGSFSLEMYPLFPASQIWSCLCSPLVTTEFRSDCIPKMTLPQNRDLVSCWIKSHLWQSDTGNLGSSTDFKSTNEDFPMLASSAHAWFLKEHSHSVSAIPTPLHEKVHFIPNHLSFISVCLLTVWRLCPPGQFPSVN